MVQLSDCVIIRHLVPKHHQVAEPLQSEPPQSRGAAAEQEMIARVLSGEHDVFYELIRLYERRVFLAAFALLQNSADAEEVAQETVLKAFRHLDSFRGEARFSTWLLRIALNEARMFLRKTRGVSLRSLAEMEESDYEPIYLASWREVPSTVWEQKELREELTHCLALLPEAYRETLVLRDIEGYSIQETARLLNISKNNVKIRLLRARLKMRDMLAPKLQSWCIRREKE